MKGEILEMDYMEDDFEDEAEEANIQQVMKSPQTKL